VGGVNIPITEEPEEKAIPKKSNGMFRLSVKPIFAVMSNQAVVVFGMT
jgi:hypothetical protein